VPEHDDILIERIAATLRATPATDAATGSRVMEAVRRLPPHRAGSVVSIARWLVRPRAVRLTPLAALAAAAAVVALWFLVPPSRREPTHPVADGRPVQFVLVAPGASTVAVVGDFNDWDPNATPLAAAPAGGVWTAVVVLPPGRHRYAFLVDSTRWVADPAAPPAGDDGFGTPNSVLTVAS
jgi:hypothetical protein